MIRILIVEDSPVEQALLTRILNSDPRIRVIGVAEDGEKAVADVERLRPDVVTMDIHMPRLNGFDATRRIMESTPVPIVIVSGSFTRQDADKTFRAMEAGALTVVRKPRGIGHPDHLNDTSELIRTVKMMSEVKVIRRWPSMRREEPPPSSARIIARTVAAQIRVVAIGASTGGPAALQVILAALPKDFAAPLLVVQHMSAGFTESFAAWLTFTTGFPARVARHNESMTPGCAYFAPDGAHMRVARDGRIALSCSDPENGLRPSIAHLFRSVAEAFGRNSAGVILTGMGKDGAHELKQMKEKGAVTIAQDPESCVVAGMPGEAVAIGAAEFILPPREIAQILTQLVNAGKG